MRRRQRLLLIAILVILLWNAAGLVFALPR
jgi:hypothetical protein